MSGARPPSVVVCMSLCMCARACLYVSLLFFFITSKSEQLIVSLFYVHVCLYVHWVRVVSFNLPLSVPHLLFVSKPVVYIILIKVIKGLSEVLYILMIAVHIEHLPSTYFCQPL